MYCWFLVGSITSVEINLVVILYKAKMQTYTMSKKLKIFNNYWKHSEPFLEIGHWHVDMYSSMIEVHANSTQGDHYFLCYKCVSEVLSSFTHTETFLQQLLSLRRWFLILVLSMRHQNWYTSSVTSPHEKAESNRFQKPMWPKDKSSSFNPGNWKFFLFSNWCTSRLLWNYILLQNNVWW